MPAELVDVAAGRTADFDGKAGQGTFVLFSGSTSAAYREAEADHFVGIDEMVGIGSGADGRTEIDR